MEYCLPLCSFLIGSAGTYLHSSHLGFLLKICDIRNSYWQLQASCIFPRQFHFYIQNYMERCNRNISTVRSLWH